MSDIHVVRQHRLSVKDAKKIAQKTADDLAEEYGLLSEWDGDRLVFKRSGVAGCVRVDDQRIDLSVALGFLLKPFKFKIEQHIERRLDDLLAGSTKVKVARRAAARKRA
jgi:putative polyhydroxyalkanoate system protein